jgi:hypothetical protein
MTAATLVKLNVLLPLIMTRVNKCPEPYALLQARLAAIDYCEKTRCWRHVTQVELTDNHTAIVTPTGSTIFEFEQATHNGNDLIPIQFTQADPEEMSGLSQGAQPKWISQIRAGEVAVYPFAAGTLRLSAFLKPRHGQLFGTDPTDPLHDAYNVIPEYIATQFGKAIADGALARIFTTKDASFYDPQLAGFHATEFRDACQSQSANNIRGQQRAPIRTNPRWL